jgi:hypothetical protein
MSFQPGKFTSIKGSFSENRRIPRLGRIRLGIKVQKQQNGKPVLNDRKEPIEFPKETDYFVVPPEVEAIYGKQPKELDVMFPLEDERLVFPASLKWYGRAKGLRCHGNGETAERLDEKTGKWGEMKCPCDKLKSETNPKGECTEQANLMVMLPRVSLGGIYQIATGSYHSVVDINSGIDMCRQMVGRIQLVPLKLRREERVTHKDGRPSKHYTLTLILDANAGGINKLREVTDRVLEHARYQIEGPAEVNPHTDPPDEFEDAETVEHSVVEDPKPAQAEQNPPVSTPKAPVGGTKPPVAETPPPNVETKPAPATAASTQPAPAPIPQPTSAPVAESTQAPADDTAPLELSPTGGLDDMVWLGPILEFEDAIRQEQNGKQRLATIRAFFQLTGGDYPQDEDSKASYGQKIRELHAELCGKGAAPVPAAAAAPAVPEKTGPPPTAIEKDFADDAVWQREIERLMMKDPGPISEALRRMGQSSAFTLLVHLRQPFLNTLKDVLNDRSKGRKAR